MKILAPYFVFFLLINLTLSAQEIKFGKVSKQELQEKAYPLDATAPAAVLYKKRRSHFEFNADEGFSLVTKVHERIKIYDKGGLEWVKKNVDAYQNKGARETVGIKAYTFNLENGKILKDKLKKKDIFKEKVSDHWTSYKFTMPNAKVGSVVDWEYTITSPFPFNINDVIFQYKIPIKRIEATIEIPQYYTFKYQPNFYYPIHIKASKRNRTLRYTYRTSNGVAKTTGHAGSQDLYEMIYEAKEFNIPAIKNEPLINNLDNYIAKVHFEYASKQFPNQSVKYYSTNWASVAKSIYKSIYFGKQLKNTNHLKAAVTAQIADAKTVDEKALRLFHFIKTQIKWDGVYGKYTEKGLKKAFQEHVGNSSDINLNLVAMFREAGLKANPILVSTRSNGIPLFPTKDGFNYVIAGLELPRGLVLFDATEPFSAPNVLPLRDLNWNGRLVRDDETSSSVNLFSVKPAKKRITLFVKMDEEGLIKGMKRSSFYTNFALNYRKNKAFLAEKDLIVKVENENKGIEITNLKITNKENIFKPVGETFKFEAEGQCDVINDKIYFQPLLFLATTKNPFMLEKRLYPVDFGSKWEENYTVSIQIPDGYNFTTIPKNFGIGLPENMGEFKYVIVQKGANKLQVLTSIKFNTPIIPPNYYAELKDFFKQVVEKQTEKVVLTKL